MAKEKKDKQKEEKKIKSSGKGERFADMSATAEIIKEPDVTEEIVSSEKGEKKPKASKTRSKKYKDAKKKIDPAKTYPIKEAITLLKDISSTKFPSSVEVHLNVVEKGLSGEASLPYFKGKEKKIAIFDEKTEKEIKAGKVDFDILLATQADMPKILPLAKTLGPKGLMPNPKNGTLTPDPKSAKEKFSSGGMHYKTDKDFPIIHVSIGKLEQPETELIANFEALIGAINPKRITKTIVKSTMSPAIKISL